MQKLLHAILPTPTATVRNSDWGKECVHCLGRAPEPVQRGAAPTVTLCLTHLQILEKFTRPRIYGRAAIGAKSAVWFGGIKHSAFTTRLTLHQVSCD